MSITFQFNFARTLQASAHLLRLDNKRMSYFRLLKLLYIADREWLAESGESITGDRVYAMRHGPVLGTVYDLIKGDSPKSGAWDDYIHKDGYQLLLVNDPGRGDLSRGIIDKLSEVTARHREDNDWDVADATRTFAEWEKHGPGGSHPIPWQDVLQAQGKSDMVEPAQREEAEKRFFDSFFGPEP